MGRSLFIFLFVTAPWTLWSQAKGELILQGDFTARDSLQVVEAFTIAYDAVEAMHLAWHDIWDAGSTHRHSQRKLRKERWLADSLYVKWLGAPNKLRMVHRRIERMHRKFNKRFVLHVTKANRSRCKGWISAWTLPYGKVKIWLCDDYFKYRTHLQEKVIVHELGHEAGMLFHRRIHGCWAAKKAARSHRNKLAKRSPENYAWLAMSYVGLECDY